MSPDILSWEPWLSSAKSVDQSRWKRPYELHAHAERLLATAASEMSIADAVLNLRRAIGMRTRHLEELYRFKALFRDVEGVLERLEVVGLARPFLIRQLIDLRDDIEHKDLRPPSATRCRELADAAWYFLRSTDSAAKTMPEEIQLSPPGGGPTCPDNYPYADVRSKGGPAATTCQISGWLPQHFFSVEERPTWLPLTGATVRNKHEFPGIDALLQVSQRGEKSALMGFAEKFGQHVFRTAMRNEDERHVVGEWQPSPEYRRTICRLMLESLY